MLGPQHGPCYHSLYLQVGSNLPLGVVVKFIQQQDYFLTCKGWPHLEVIQTNTLSCKELYEYKHLHGRDLHLGR